MAIRPKTHARAISFLKTIEIAKNILENSESLAPDLKFGLLNWNTISKKLVENGLGNDDLTAASLKSIESQFFTFWTQSVNEEVELFWEELQKQQLSYPRKSPVRNLLKKGYFKDVEQWIGLINHFSRLEQIPFFNEQFSKTEILQIKDLIEAEKLRRFELVNKCFQKKKIPKTYYLKFGEAMAFLERCNLMSNFFSPKERDDLVKMWTSVDYS